LLKSLEEKYAYRYRRRLAISDDNDDKDYGDASDCFADRRAIPRSRVNARGKLSLIITLGNSSSSIRFFIFFSPVRCTLDHCNCIIAFSSLPRFSAGDFGVSPTKETRHREISTHNAATYNTLLMLMFKNQYQLHKISIRIKKNILYEKYFLGTDISDFYESS